MAQPVKVNMLINVVMDEKMDSTGLFDLAAFSNIEDWAGRASQRKRGGHPND